MDLRVRYRMLWQPADLEFEAETGTPSLVYLVSRIPFPTNAGRVVILYHPDCAKDVEHIMAFIHAAGFSDVLAIPKKEPTHA